MTAKPTSPQAQAKERTFAIDDSAGLQTLWQSVLEALKRSGVPQAGPEYLKLSLLVTNARRAQLLAGKTTVPAGWERLRRTAQETADLLQPLFEAARLIASLPIGLAAAAPLPGVCNPPAAPVPPAVPAAPATAVPAAPATAVPAAPATAVPTAPATATPAAELSQTSPPPPATKVGGRRGRRQTTPPATRPAAKPAPRRARRVSVPNPQKSTKE